MGESFPPSLSPGRTKLLILHLYLPLQKPPRSQESGTQDPVWGTEPASSSHGACGMGPGRGSSSRTGGGSSLGHQQPQQGNSALRSWRETPSQAKGWGVLMRASVFPFLLPHSPTPSLLPPSQILTFFISDLDAQDKVSIMENKSRNQSGGESELFSPQFKKPAPRADAGAVTESRASRAFRVHTQSPPPPPAPRKALEMPPLSCCRFQGSLMEWASCGF